MKEKILLPLAIVGFALAAGILVFVFVVAPVLEEVYGGEQVVPVRLAEPAAGASQYVVTIDGSVLTSFDPSRYACASLVSVSGLSNRDDITESLLMFVNENGIMIVVSMQSQSVCWEPEIRDMGAVLLEPVTKNGITGELHKGFLGGTEIVYATSP